MTSHLQIVILQHTAGPQGLSLLPSASSTSIIKEIEHLNLLLQLNNLQRMPRSSYWYLDTSCPKRVLVFHEKIGKYTTPLLLSFCINL